MNRFLRLFRWNRWPALIAAGCATLVLLLAILAADPSAHRWLHADSDHEDHSCAVVLFAHGLTSALAEIILTLVAWRLLSVLGRAGEVLHLAAPAYFLQPACGPPVR
jgi:hypothetical protein